jgi:hypothetical protein
MTANPLHSKTEMIYAKLHTKIDNQARMILGELEHKIIAKDLLNYGSSLDERRQRGI